MTQCSLLFESYVCLRRTLWRLRGKWLVMWEWIFVSFWVSIEPCLDRLVKCDMMEEEYLQSSNLMKMLMGCVAYIVISSHVPHIHVASNPHIQFILSYFVSFLCWNYPMLRLLKWNNMNIIMNLIIAGRLIKHALIEI